MSDVTYLNHVRVLISSCGCIGAADTSDEVPGFCRSIEEAREDVRDGFTESTMSPEAFRAARMGCEHTPEYGRRR